MLVQECYIVTIGARAGGGGGVARGLRKATCSAAGRQNSLGLRRDGLGPRPIASAQTILDQRGLESAQEVGGLPEAEQQAVVAAIVRREQGIMALSALVVVFLLLRAAETAHGI